MPQYRLIATNDRAKALIGPHGCDIVLYGDTRIGRGVAGPQTFTLPVDWLQFSSRHCRVYSADGNHWHVEDTSTNGTYVNDVRVPKNGSLPLPLGARLRLSNIGMHDPILEFELKRFEEAQPEPEAGSVKALPGGSGMKRHSLSQATGSDLKKKSRLEGSRGKGASPLSAGPTEKEELAASLANARKELRHSNEQLQQARLAEARLAAQVTQERAAKMALVAAGAMPAKAVQGLARQQDGDIEPDRHAAEVQALIREVEVLKAELAQAREAAQTANADAAAARAQAAEAEEDRRSALAAAEAAKEAAAEFKRTTEEAEAQASAFSIKAQTAEQLAGQARSETDAAVGKAAKAEEGKKAATAEVERLKQQLQLASDTALEMSRNSDTKTGRLHVQLRRETEARAAADEKVRALEADLAAAVALEEKVTAEAEAWQGRAEQAVHDLAEAKAQHRALMDSAAALAQRHTTMEYWVADIAKSLLQTPAALARLDEARTACLQAHEGVQSSLAATADLLEGLRAIPDLIQGKVGAVGPGSTLPSLPNMPMPGTTPQPSPLKPRGSHGAASMGNGPRTASSEPAASAGVRSEAGLPAAPGGHSVAGQPPWSPQATQGPPIARGAAAPVAVGQPSPAPSARHSSPQSLAHSPSQPTMQPHSRTQAPRSTQAQTQAPSQLAAQERSQLRALAQAPLGTQAASQPQAASQASTPAQLATQPLSPSAMRARSQTPTKTLSRAGTHASQRSPVQTSPPSGARPDSRVLTQRQHQPAMPTHSQPLSKVPSQQSQPPASLGPPLPGMQGASPPLASPPGGSVGQGEAFSVLEVLLPTQAHTPAAPLAPGPRTFLSQESKIPDARAQPRTRYCCGKHATSPSHTL
ncbi:hypothetical protein ACKKBF_B30710 [Auxenochlorella protothecoides x Auxenochlorella symbiontica]